MTKLAKFTSDILNPFLSSFIIIVLLSMESTAGISETLKWAAISLVLSVIPILCVVIGMVRMKKLDGLFVNPREQRTRIYLLATVLAVIGCIVLYILGAPQLLLAVFISGLAAILSYMIINLFWKISLHTAFVAASVTILVIVYRAAAAWTIVLLPLVAWARVQLKMHTTAQVVSGALLASVLVVIVFQLFGLVV